MILTVENAIIERLKRGLGTSIKTVEPYGGQFDEAGLKHVAKVMPALYVGFAGLKESKPKNTTGELLLVPATFTVFVATRNVANEAAGRRGTAKEVGAYQLIGAVRKLLVNQSLGLKIKRFKAGPMPLLGNVKVGTQGLTVYGCSFDTAWDERLRDVEGFPLASDPIFVGLDGERADEPPDLLRIGLKHDVNVDGVVDVTDVVTLKEH